MLDDTIERLLGKSEKDQKTLERSLKKLLKCIDLLLSSLRGLEYDNEISSISDLIDSLKKQMGGNLSVSDALEALKKSLEKLDPHDYNEKNIRTIRKAAKLLKNAAEDKHPHAIDDLSELEELEE